MGRELKRVPLDFDWPLNETWPGYLNPFHEFKKDCESCSGSGYAPMARIFSDQWYGNADFDPLKYGAKPLTADHPAVIRFATRNVDHSPDFYRVMYFGRDEAIAREASRLFGHFRNQWCHHLIQADVDVLIAEGRLTLGLPKDYHPNADEVNAWSLYGLGHDAINQMICVRARCGREGVPVRCPSCRGDGQSWPSRAHRNLAESWQDIEPPTGDGFQLWENTSEGSPISPAFASLESLCEWCESNATTVGDKTATASRWLSMLDGGVVCHKEGNMIFM